MTLGAKHWLDRAEQARAVAKWMGNPKAKRLLLEIAERYEKIAKIPEAATLGRVTVSRIDE